MGFIDTLLSKLAPHICVGCGQEGTLLCSGCSDTLSDPNIYISRGSLRTVGMVTVYEGFARDLVWQFKFRGAQAAAGAMAKHMALLVPAGEDTVIVPVPTASRRIRQRGFDQAKLLARQISKLTGLLYMDCLHRYGQTHQVGASRRERLVQLENAFRVKKGADLQNRRIVLIDDVLTTGATLESAAAVLKDAGVTWVDGVVFARAD